MNWTVNHTLPISSQFRSHSAFVVSRNADEQEKSLHVALQFNSPYHMNVDLTTVLNPVVMSRLRVSLDLVSG